MSLNSPQTSQAITTSRLPHSRRCQFSYPPLAQSIEVDVAMIGGGLSSFTAALALHRMGMRIAVLAPGRILESANSPAPTCHDFVEPPEFSRWLKQLGLNSASELAAANRSALDELEARAQECSDCHFSRLPAYFLAEATSSLSRIEEQCAAGKALRGDCWYTREPPTPFHCAGATRIDFQGKIHSEALLRGMAAEFHMLGGEIYENSPCMAANSALEGGAVSEIKTERGRVKAKHVLLATRSPLSSLGRMDSVLALHHTYVIAARVEEVIGDAIFVDDGSVDSGAPRHTMHRAVGNDPSRILFHAEYIGEQSGGQHRKFDELAVYAAKRFSVRAIEARWSEHRLIAKDQLPVAGRVPGFENLYVTAGLGAKDLPWGMTSGAVISKLICGEAHPLAELFDPKRLLPSSSAVEPGRRRFNDAEYVPASADATAARIN